MQAIQTKYLGPTDSRGSRIKATAGGGESITIPYPYEAREGVDAHAIAARALADKLHWTGTLVGGALPDGYAFVFTDAGATYPLGGGSAMHTRTRKRSTIGAAFPW